MVHAKRETFECINGILGKMNPALRQAFTMTYYDELSGPEACAVLGISAGTFRRGSFGQDDRFWIKRNGLLWPPFIRRPFGVRILEMQITPESAGT